MSRRSLHTVPVVENQENQVSSAVLPAIAPSRRAWVTGLPLLLVAAVRGASYLAAKGITTTHTVIAVLVLRFAIVLPALAVVGWRGLRALTGAQWRGAGLLGLVLGGRARVMS